MIVLGEFADWMFDVYRFGGRSCECIFFLSVILLFAIFDFYRFGGRSCEGFFFCLLSCFLPYLISTGSEGDLVKGFFFVCYLAFCHI